MFKDLVLANRSYRGFDSSVIVRENDLLDMVDCARLSASSVNMQPLKFYVTNDAEEVNSLLLNTYWAKGLPDMELPRDNEGPTAFIVVVQDTELNNNLNRFLKDVGIVSQTILLSAVEKGYGGCMIGNYRPEVIRTILKLDENLEPLLVIALGKPIEDIRIVDVDDNQTKYYRDEDNVHYVPKRKLKDIVIRKGDK